MIRPFFLFQVYCTEQGLPMGHLYEIKDDGSIKGLTQHHMKAWVKRIFEEWTWGNLDLRVPSSYINEDGDLAYAEYGQGQSACARIPALVNYVPTGCNCQKTPSCETTSMHKFEFYIGRKQVKTTLDLETPVTLACSYFKQIDIFRHEAIIFRPDELAVKKGHVFNCFLSNSGIRNINSKTSVLSEDMKEYFATMADFEGELDSFDLRNEMKKALIQDWSDGVVSAPEVGAIGGEIPEEGDMDWKTANFTYRLYFEQCAPSQCHEIRLQDPDILTFFLAAVAGFIQIAAFIATVIGIPVGLFASKIWPSVKQKVAHYKVHATEMK